MSRDEDKSDWFELMLAVLNPALIIGLVGSLAYFLIDIGYAGEYDGRLRWTFSFFVFGAVLVARISLLMGSERGFLYGLVLGGATYLATAKFVGGIGWLTNLTIILTIAATAYVLVRDCTISETSEADAERGLMVAMTTAAANPIHEPDLKPRRHGHWVIGFTLAAWVIFGLGQSLIPPENVARRQSAMRLMVVYVACGLGLLLTTALVNLRQYLRTRRLKMPAAVTGLWLGAGGGLILLGLLLGAFVPRPHPEVAFLGVQPLGAVDREASKKAMDSKKGGEGQGDPGGGQNKNDDKEDGKGQGSPDEKSKGQSKEGKKGRDGETKSDKAEPGDEKGEDGEPSQPPAPKILEGITNFLQKIVQFLMIAIIVMVILFLLLRYFSTMSERARNMLAAFANWWQRLFGRADEPIQIDEAPAVVRPPRSFATFADPFADGSAAGRSEADLIRHSFAALEAWGRERDLPRRIDETPLEYAGRVGATEAALRQPAAQLASLYALVAYTRRRCPSGTRSALEQLWIAFGQTESARVPETMANS